MVPCPWFRASRRRLRARRWSRRRQSRRAPPPPLYLGAKIPRTRDLGWTNSGRRVAPRISTARVSILRPRRMRRRMRRLCRPRRPHPAACDRRRTRPTVRQRAMDSSASPTSSGVHRSGDSFSSKRPRRPVRRLDPGRRRTLEAPLGSHQASRRRVEAVRTRRARPAPQCRHRPRPRPFGRLRPRSRNRALGNPWSRRLSPRRQPGERATPSIGSRGPELRRASTRRRRRPEALTPSSRKCVRPRRCQCHRAPGDFSDRSSGSIPTAFASIGARRQRHSPLDTTRTRSRSATTSPSVPATMIASQRASRSWRMSSRTRRAHATVASYHLSLGRGPRPTVVLRPVHDTCRAGR